jgi:hypothetical protein
MQELPQASSKRAMRVRAIQAELSKHGIPLHWETIAVMVIDKYRALFTVPREVVEVLALHPDIFRAEGEGIYALQRERKTPQSTDKVVLDWPSTDTAFFLGTLCARGSLSPEDDIITIGFRYGGRAYSHRGRTGYIGKGKVSFKAAEVVPQVPRAVAKRLRRLLQPLPVTVEERGPANYEITVDCYSRQGFVGSVSQFLGPGSSYSSFNVPGTLRTDTDDVKKSFLRGFGQVCGLASAGTNLFGGTEQVWLRPATENKPLFHQLMDLLKQMGLIVYWNDRDERDISIKVNCEDWQRIGFGIGWLDKIVAEGARLNSERPSRRRSRDAHPKLL